MKQVLYIAAVLLHIVSCYQFFTMGGKWYEIVFFMILHIINMLLILFALEINKIKTHDAWIRNAFYVNLLFPLFGIYLFFIYIRFIPNKKTGSFVKEYEEYVRYQPVDAGVLLSETHLKSALDEKFNIQSFTDIINALGNVELKIKIIDQLSKTQTQWAIDLLKKAQDDLSPEVSYVAATALVNIETPILEDISHWKKLNSLNDQDVTVHIKLASLYWNYCYLGILDETNETFYLSLAEKSYEKALNLQPDKSEILLELGKVYLKLKKTDKAELCINKYIDHHPKDKNGYIWKAEMLYLSKNYSALKLFLKELRRGKIADWEQFEQLTGIWI